MPETFMEVDLLGEQTDNQYLLALAIARRVRKLRSGAPSLVDNVPNPGHRPFQNAMEEFSQKKISYGLPEAEQ